MVQQANAAKMVLKVSMVQLDIQVILVLKGSVVILALKDPREFLGLMGNMAKLDYMVKQGQLVSLDREHLPL